MVVVVVFVVHGFVTMTITITMTKALTMKMLLTMTITMTTTKLITIPVVSVVPAVNDGSRATVIFGGDVNLEQNMNY